MISAATVLDWKPVEEALAAFRAEYAGIDDLVEELFEQLDKLRGQLAQKAAEVEQHRREAEARGRQLDDERQANHRLMEQFEQQERRLSDALALLEQVKHGLDEVPAPAPGGFDVTPLQTEIERLAHERDALRSQLEAARADAPHWTKLLAEIERLGGNLEERLSTAPPPATNGDPAELERVSLLEQERAALVAELEQVRSRSAELHEHLNSQQREHAEQNARLAEEIQQLRQLVERQAEAMLSMPRGEASFGEAEDAGTSRKADAGQPAADPVVSSVMAQFAQLQKDVAKRRKRK